MSRAAGLDYRFGAALAASLAVHAAAMTFSLPAPRLAAFEAPALLNVHLLRPPPLAQELENPVAPIAEKSASVKRVPRKQETVPIARTAPPPLPPPATKHAMEVPNEARAPVPETVGVPPITSSLEPAPTPTPPPPPPVAVYAPAAPPAPAALPVPATELLASYGKTISQALARYKEYPRIAQMRGWEGSLTMQLRVAPSGQLLDAELRTSSGYPMLDEQALAMAARAKRFPEPPEGLRDGEIVVLVPVVFRLSP